VKIDKNVPIPLARYGQRVRDDVMSKLEIGDSFVVENNKEACNWYQSARKVGIKLARRKMKDESFRMWRVS